MLLHIITIYLSNLLFLPTQKNRCYYMCMLAIKKLMPKLAMPIVSVSMYSGRTQTEKDRLAEAITDDVVKLLKVERKDVA
jgi:Tautomerase enzyme